MTPTIDLQDAPLYKLDFTDSDVYVNVYGYKVQLPKPAPDEECINYGLPEDEQIFRKTNIPSGLNHLSRDDQDIFVEREYHRRKNGVWIFIKGKKYYLPGVFYYFLNYWKLKSGVEVIFRMTDLHFFLMWMHCARDPLSLGLIDFKCRQIGDTEKVLCIIYEFATRFRNVKCAMQSINENHIKKTYQRLTYAHNKMVYFMQPVNKGTDRPDAALEFQKPTQVVSVKKQKEQAKLQGTINASDLDYEFPLLESEIQYGPSDPIFSDGQTWNIYYMDEFGKMDRMDPIEAWGVVQPALMNRIIDKIVGKGIFTSTVEELKSGKSLKWAKRLWKDADPNNRIPETGMTQNGLYRIFRSSLDRAPVDKWGFPKVEEELRLIKAKMRGFMTNKDMKGLIKYRRKNPITIDDVFLSAENESTFHIENLAARQLWLMEQKAPKAVRGNLKWKDGKRDTEVIWEPNPNGRWFISQHPSEHKFDNNAMIEQSTLPKPANIQHYCGGVDPYDQKTTIEDDVSLGGIVVRRKYDSNYDGGKWDAEGKPLDGGADWETDRVVCDYLFRWKNPNDFYEDIILTFVYFGTQFLFEKNKGGGLESYITTRGYGLYIQEQPQFTRSKKAQNQELVGITATENSVNEAFELIQTETCDRCNTMHHPRYIEQLLRMNWENRGENDIGMAGGWALVSSKRVVAKRKTEEDRKKIRHHTINMV